MRWQPNYAGVATVGLDVIPPIRLRVIMSGLSLSFKTWVSLPVYLLAQLYSRTIHAKTYCPNSILIPLTYRGVTACEHISSTALYTHTHKHTIYRHNSGSSPPIRQQKRRVGGKNILLTRVQACAKSTKKERTGKGTDTTNMKSATRGVPLQNVRDACNLIWHTSCLHPTPLFLIRPH
jgi:hypothetical protein